MITTLTSTEPIVKNSDAERGFLSCVCRDPDCLADAMEQGAEGEWFTVPTHIAIWDKIKQLGIEDSTTLDMLVVMEFGLEDRHSVNDILGACESSGMYRAFRDKLIDCHRRRSIRKLSMKMAESSASDEFETADQVLEYADREITALTILKDKTTESAREVVASTWDSIMARQALGGMDGIPSGIQKLDQMTYGWKAGDMVIVAARTSIGKTALACELTKSSILNGHSTLLFTLEMSNESVMERMLASESEVPIRLIVDKTTNSTQDRRVEDAKKQLSQAPLYMDDAGTQTFSKIRAKARRMARRKLDMIVIDYAQLILPEPDWMKSGMKRHEQVGMISRSIKLLAKELEIPIIILAQLSREADGPEKPRLRHLRESGSLEQDADVVMMLWRRDDDPAKSVISISKQRQGRVGDVEVEFDPNIQKFLPKTLTRMNEGKGYSETVIDIER